MKTRNNKFFRIILLGVVVSLIPSCATGKKAYSPGRKNTQEGNQSVPGNENGTYGPVDPNPSEIRSGDESTYGPSEPTQVRPVTLVLGPGMARGFAYIGVFQALAKSKVPIGAVVGTEMGALIGSIYSFSTNINQFEWNLLKLKENAFQENYGFLSKWSGSPAMNGERLESQLKMILENKDLQEARIPVHIGIALEKSRAVSAGGDHTRVLSQGNAVATVRAAMAAQGYFAPVKWVDGSEQVKALSTGKTHPFLVEEARRLNSGPVIVVDVMDGKETGMILDELKGADLVIRPDMRGIQTKDFQKKTDAAFRGKNAIIQHIAEIRQLVGMPELVD